MILQLFAIRDSKADTFLNPFFLLATGQAIRSVSDEVNRNSDAANQLFHHASDFELFHLGAFDTQSAIFDIFPRPQSLGVCSNFKINGSP